MEQPVISMTVAIHAKLNTLRQKFKHSVQDA